MRKLPVTGHQLSEELIPAKFRRGSGWLVWMLLWLIVFAGCVPARVPDNLDDTPGPPVVVSDDWYQGVAFSARVPDGWRIITSESRVPQAVIFAAPDNVAVIRLISGPVEAADVIISGQRNTMEEITLSNGTIITSVLSAPADQWTAFERVYKEVRESVEANTSTH